MSASIRCGRRSSSASTNRGCGSIPVVWAPWASDCLPRSARSSRSPDKLVFAIVGDGGFQMSLPELATIVNHGLPIKIIVMNNGYLGMVRQWQELFYNNRLSSVTLDCFPDAECWRQRTASRAARSRTRANCAKLWKKAVARTGSVPAERQGDAV